MPSTEASQESPGPAARRTAQSDTGIAPGNGAGNKSVCGLEQCVCVHTGGKDRSRASPDLFTASSLKFLPSISRVPDHNRLSLAGFSTRSSAPPPISFTHCGTHRSTRPRRRSGFGSRRPATALRRERQRSIPSVCVAPPRDERGNLVTA